jgi:hypothetical protein
LQTEQARAFRERRERQSWRSPKASRGNAVFQAKAPEAFEVLCKHLHASDPRFSVAAAKEILDRAYGRPPQVIDATISEDPIDQADGGNPDEITVFGSMAQ